MTTKRPAKKYMTMKVFKSKHDKNFLWLFNHDYWRGRRDGKISPSACGCSLETIRAEEQHTRDEFRNGIHQTLGEGHRCVEHLDEQLKDNQKQQDDLSAREGLMPESMAQSMYAASVRSIIFACFLMLVEFCGLFAIAKTTFGSGFLSALAVSILLSSIIAIGVHLLLGKMSRDTKRKMRIALISTGCLLGVTGLVGFVLLRAVTFSGSISGNALDFEQIMLANKLLMLGLTLGVPMVVGALFEEALENLRMSRNSLILYRDKNQMVGIKAEWVVMNQILGEFDQRLDQVCAQVIKCRQNRYLRGFTRGGAKNPESKTVLKQVEAQQLV